MMRALATILLGLIIAVCSVSVGNAKRHKRPPAPPSASGWYFSYSINPPLIAADASFLWTASPYVEIDYLRRAWTGPVQSSQAVSITYKIEAVTGAPVIQSTECTATQNPAARAALIITNGSDSTYYDRAWWISTAPMTLGTHTITAPLGNGAGWTFVAGGSAGDPVQNPVNWANMLANIKAVGLTFNGCSSMGHGAYVTGGTAKFTIVSVTVQ
jgi:hypothetical protein